MVCSRGSKPTDAAGAGRRVISSTPVPRTSHRMLRLAGCLVLAGALVGIPVTAVAGVPHAAAHVPPDREDRVPETHAHGHTHAHPHHDHSHIGHLEPEPSSASDAAHGHEHRDDVPPHRHELDSATFPTGPSGLHGPGQSPDASLASTVDSTDPRHGSTPTLDRPGPDPPKRRSLLCVLLL